MSLITDFVAELEAVPEVVATSAQVTPLISAGIYPAIVYTVLSGVGIFYYRDSQGLTETQFDVSIYTTTYAQLQAIKEAVIEKFHGFSGLLNSTTIASSIKVTNTLESVETSKETLYRATIQIEVVS